MCEYTDECVCHQAAGPSHPLSTAISQSPDACSPGEMLLSCWCRLAVFCPSCSQCGRIRTPEPGQSYPGEETCPPPSCPWLTRAWPSYSNLVPPPQQRCKEALSWVWRQAVRLKVGMCDTAAVRLSMGYGMCRS